MHRVKSGAAELKPNSPIFFPAEIASAHPLPLSASSDERLGTLVLLSLVLLKPTSPLLFLSVRKRTV